MKFEWDDYHKYSDWSWHSGSDCTVTLDNGTEYRLHITDHTTEKQKADDKRCGRDVYYAWELSDNLRIFDACWGINNGFDKNEDRRNSPYCYVSSPKHTLEEVKNFYEHKVCVYFCFDYEKELEEFIKILNDRKKLMDEAKMYEKTLESTTLVEGK